MTKKHKNIKQQATEPTDAQVETGDQVVVATSNMDLLNEVFERAGMDSFEEQFNKMARKLAEQIQLEKTEKEGRDGE